MTPENIARVAEAKRCGDVIPGTNGLTFEWGLQSIDGGWFRLLREPHHTDEDVTRGKHHLRNNRDVVSLGVEKLR